VEEALDQYSAAKRAWLDVLESNAVSTATTVHTLGDWGDAAGDGHQDACDDESSLPLSAAGGGNSSGRWQKSKQQQQHGHGHGHGEEQESGRWQSTKQQQHEQECRQGKEQEAGREGGQQGEEQEGAGQVLLPAAAELYFAAVMSSVHLTAGADQAAWHVLVEAVPALVELHEAGAEAGLWHSCAGVVLYHLDQLQVIMLVGKGTGRMSAKGCVRESMPADGV
jgi:hypothetical protein